MSETAKVLHTPCDVLEFHTRVRATVLLPGETVPAQITGTIRGRTVERKPRYDVMDDKGVVYSNLAADDVRKDTAA